MRRNFSEMTDIDVRCDNFNFGQKIGFYFLRTSELEKGEYRQSYAVEIKNGLLTMKPFAEDNVEVTPLFKLSVPEVINMIKNITELFDKQGFKLDYTTVYEKEIEGLKKQLEEKERLLQLSSDWIQSQKEDKSWFKKMLEND